MKKVLSNFIYQASYQVLLIFLPIVTIPIVSSALGKNGIGTYNFVTSIVNYFVLVAGLGLANYGVREIAIVRGNRRKLSKKFWELQFFNLFFSSSSFLLFLIFAVTRNDAQLYLIQSMIVLAAVFDISWFYSGIENFKKITIRNFFIKIATFILIVIFIKNENDLTKYFIIQSGGTLLGALSLWVNLKEYITFEKVSMRDIFAHFLPALSFFTAKIAISLYQNLTKTILGIAVGMGAVGLYSNSMSLITMTGSIMNAMNTVMIPKMSNLVSDKGEEGLIPILQKVIHLQLYITIAMSFGIAGISGTLVPWFFGNDFFELTILLPLISPVLIFQSLQMSIATQYLIPLGRMKDYNISVIIGAITSIVLTWILAPYIEVTGAIIGIGTGYVVITLLRSYRLIKDSDFRYNFSEIMRYIISAVIMSITIYSVGMFFNPSMFVTIFQIILGTVIYFSISFMFKANPLIKILKII